MNTDTYVYDDAAIRTLTLDYVKSLNSVSNSRTTYLRALVTATQKELGSEPRQNNTKRAKLDEEGQARQLAALEKCHQHYYDIICTTVDGTLEDVPAKERAKVKNSRTNFGRSAYYAARMYRPGASEGE